MAQDCNIVHWVLLKRNVIHSSTSHTTVPYCIPGADLWLAARQDPKRCRRKTASFLFLDQATAEQLFPTSQSRDCRGPSPRPGSGHAHAHRELLETALPLLPAPPLPLHFTLELRDLFPRGNQRLLECAHAHLGPLRSLPLGPHRALRLVCPSTLLLLLLFVRNGGGSGGRSGGSLARPRVRIAHERRAPLFEQPDVRRVLCAQSLELGELPRGVEHSVVRRGGECCADTSAGARGRGAVSEACTESGGIRRWGGVLVFYFRLCVPF